MAVSCKLMLAFQFTEAASYATDVAGAIAPLPYHVCKPGHECQEDDDCCYGVCTDGRCGTGEKSCAKMGEECRPGVAGATANVVCCYDTISSKCGANSPNLPCHQPNQVKIDCSKPRCGGLPCSEGKDRCAPYAPIVTAAIGPSYSCVRAEETPTPKCPHEYCMNGTSCSSCRYNPKTNACNCFTRLRCESQRCDPEGKRCYAPPTPTPTAHFCECYETDQGYNPSTKGTTYGPLNGDCGVHEYYCTQPPAGEPAVIGASSYVCCSNGVCQ